MWLQTRQRARIVLGPIAAIACATVAAIALPKLLIIAAAAAGYLLVRALLPIRWPLAQLTLRRDHARRRLRDLETLWRNQAGPRDFERKLGEIEGLRRRIEALPATRSAKLQELRTSAGAIQLARFLERKRIADATIPGLGRYRRRELVSHGIEAASQISLLRLSPVRGIGRKLAVGLLKWRQSQEDQFVFQPDLAHAAGAETRVDREIAKERIRLSHSFSKSIRELRGIRQRIMAARSALRHRVEIARWNYAQAVKDLNTTTYVRLFR